MINEQLPTIVEEHLSTRSRSDTHDEQWHDDAPEHQSLAEGNTTISRAGGTNTRRTSTWIIDLSRVGLPVTRVQKLPLIRIPPFPKRNPDSSSSPLFPKKRLEARLRFIVDHEKDDDDDQEAMFQEDDAIDNLTEVASSPDHTKFAVGTEQGKVFLFHLDTSDEDDNSDASDEGTMGVYDSDEHIGFISDAAYHGPDQQLISSLAFSPEGQRMAVSWKGQNEKKSKVVIFDSTNGKVIYDIDFPMSINTVCFLNGGSSDSAGTSSRLAINGENGLQIFDLESLSETHSISSFSIDHEKSTSTNCSFSPSNNMVAVGTWAGCFLYNNLTGSLIRTFCNQEAVFATVFSPDGMMIGIVCTSEIYLYCVLGGELIRTFDHRSDNIVFSNDGKQIFCVYVGTSDVVMYGYDVASGMKVHELEIPTQHSKFSTIASLGSGREERLLISSGKQLQVYYVGVLSNELKHDTEHGFSRVIGCDAISPDNQLMATGFIDGWDCEGIAVYSTLTKKKVFISYEDVFSVAFSSNSDMVAIGGKGTITVYGITVDSQNNFSFSHAFQINHDNAKDNNEIAITKVYFSENDEILVSVASDYDDGLFSLGSGTRLFVTRIGRNKESFTVPLERGIEGISCDSQQILNDFFFVRHGGKYSIHNVEGKEDHRFDVDPTRNIKASTFFSDGSKLLLCFADQVCVYPIDALRDFDPDLAIPEQTIKLNGEDISQVKVSLDNKIAAICLASCVVICSLLGEGRVLYNILCGDLVSSAIFLPDASESQGRYLCVTYWSIATQNSFTRVFEIRDGINPTSYHDLLNKFNEEQFLRTVTEHTAPYQLNQYGVTLLAAAFEYGYFNFVDRTIGQHPEKALIPHQKHSLDGETHGVLEMFAKSNSLNVLNKIFMSDACTSSTPECVLQEIVRCIEPLSIYQASNTLSRLLNMGSKDCSYGFVRGFRCSLLTLERDGSLLSRLYNTLKIKISNTRSTPLALTAHIAPYTSESPVAGVCADFDNDDKKLVKLNACRALLPGLASFDSLRNLINMEGDRSWQGDKSALKLFHSPSLRASIDANWESWGKKRLFYQFLIYFVWILCITALSGMRRYEETSRISDIIRVTLFLGISTGWIFFLRIASLQLKHQGSFMKLFRFGWNGQQGIALIFVFLFISFELARPSSTEAIMCAAFSQLFGWNNLLWYTRGGGFSWVTFALLRLIQNMKHFLLILLLVVIAFTLFFWTLELPDQFGSFENRFLKTLFTAFFSDFDPDVDIGKTPLDLLILALNLMVLISIYVISMNAMIAFIGETYADILDDKVAVITRERACVLVDLYSVMSSKSRENLERKNRWTYKLELQSMVDKIDTKHKNSLDEIINKRSTKGDIANLKEEMRAENEKLRHEMKEMRAEYKKLGGELEIITSLLKKAVEK